MNPTRCFRPRTLLIYLLIAKLGASVFCIGTVSFSGVRFEQGEAIAQEKPPEAKPEIPAESAGTENARKTEPADDVRAVLKRLDMERSRLKAEEERIGQQRVQLEALKSEIEEKIERLSKIQQQITADLEKKEALRAEREQQQTAAEDAQIRMLSKVYASMKPKQAAAIIDKMDLEVIQKVFSQMKGEQVGNILSYVEKDRAAQISERLAQRRGEQTP